MKPEEKEIIKLAAKILAEERWHTKPAYKPIIKGSVEYYQFLNERARQRTARNYDERKATGK